MGESVECYVVGRIHTLSTSNMASVDNDTQLQKAAELVHWVNSVPLGLTICALGILGNSVSMLVWVRIHRKLRELNTTILYFVIMAVIDSGLLWMFIFKDSIPALQPEFIKTYGFCVLFCYVLFPLFYLFLMLSIWGGGCDSGSLFVAGSTVPPVDTRAYSLPGGTSSRRIRHQLAAFLQSEASAPGG